MAKLEFCPLVTQRNPSNSKKSLKSKGTEKKTLPLVLFKFSNRHLLSLSQKVQQKSLITK